jgi:hypothetical protein
MLHRLLCASLAAGLWQVAVAADSQDQRLRDIEERLQRIEGSPDQSRTAPPARPTSNVFNPAISLILDGQFTNFSQNSSTYAVPGFALAGETGPGDEGLRLGESELVLSANVDDKFYGQFNAAVTPENEVEVEEAFFETLSLGNGFTARGGRFFSGVGYLNSIHGHAWDFVDQPLVYRAMLGNQYRDDGVQLRWVAPTDLLLEIGAELFRGDRFPAGGAEHAGKGARTVFAHLGGDVGLSHAWRAGISRLNTDARNRTTGNADLFTGDSDLSLVDFVWKWAPDGNSRQRNLKFQAEYISRDEKGTFDPASAGTPLDYRGKQKGWYAQTIYQFIPRWRAGLRYSEAKANDVDAALAGSVLDNLHHKPKATSAMLDFSNSEFSRLRLQYTRDDSRPNATDNQWSLQYIMSLGPHGAHAF